MTDYYIQTTEVVGENQIRVWIHHREKLDFCKNCVMNADDFLDYKEIIEKRMAGEGQSN